jgi:hypothetical protein
MKRFLAKLKGALPEKRKTRVILGVLVALGIIGAVVLGNFTITLWAGMSILTCRAFGTFLKRPKRRTDPGRGCDPGSGDHAADFETRKPGMENPRVNLLIMGLDSRDLEATAPRTDSMILFTMDR